MQYLWFALIGIFGGIVSGLFGVGGGLIFVPLLVLLMKFDIHLAIGTSLAIVVPTALMGAFNNARAGMIDWKVVPVLTVLAVLGAWAGSKLSLQLDTLLLRRLFAGFLVVLAVKMFWFK